MLDDQPQNFWAHEESKDEQSTGSTLTSGSAASRTKRGSRGSKGDAPRRSRLSRLNARAADEHVPVDVDVAGDLRRAE